jgi:hypothetical protein
MSFPVHTVPQVPQLALSLCRFAPPLQVVLTEPLELQVLLSVPVLHVPHGCGAGAVHEHVPPWQAEPVMQALPHVPQ